METAQLSNMDIIRTVLRKPHKRFIVESCSECVETFLKADECVAIVVGFQTLKHLSQDFEYCGYYEPTDCEHEALRFIVGRFMGRLVFSSVAVPSHMFCCINVFEDQSSELQSLILAFE